MLYLVANFAADMRSRFMSGTCRKFLSSISVLLLLSGVANYGAVYVSSIS